MMLRTEHGKRQSGNALVVLFVRGAKRFFALNAGGGNEGVAEFHAVAQGVVVHKAHGAVGDCFGDGENGDIKFFENLFNLPPFVFIANALHQFHIRNGGDGERNGRFYQFGCFGVVSAMPNENIAVKYQSVAPFAICGHRHRHLSCLRGLPTFQRFLQGLNESEPCGHRLWLGFRRGRRLFDSPLRTTAPKRAVWAFRRQELRQSGAKFPVVRLMRSYCTPLVWYAFSIAQIAVF